MRFHKYQPFRKNMQGVQLGGTRPSIRLRNWLGGLAVLAVVLVLAALLELFRFGQIERSGHAEAIDGDSLRMGGVEMRLKGLDAPEYSQTCTTAAGHDSPCGKQARRALSDILRQGAIACTETGKDRYGRALATCALHGQDIGAQLVGQGFAIAYGDYEREETGARKAMRGIWAGSFERPADWRKRHPRPDVP